MVSPAYAGIDPEKCSRRTLATCLPRIRGDRPHALDGRGQGVASPPHTRGSTPGPSRHPQATPVSPAYAGIDPIFDPFLAALAGLPRIRGDRPRILGPEGRSSRSPPHTRGSTVWESMEWLVPAVSPAYAGIDPNTPAVHSPTARLPRIRGDRPHRDVRDFLRAKSPPHTRGSTLNIAPRVTGH